MTTNAFVLRAARSSLSASSFVFDIPWLSGVAICHSKRGVVRPCRMYKDGAIAFTAKLLTGATRSPARQARISERGDDSFIAASLSSGDQLSALSNPIFGLKRDCDEVADMT